MNRFRTTVIAETIATSACGGREIDVGTVDSYGNVPIWGKGVQVVAGLPEVLPKKACLDRGVPRRRLSW